MYIPGIKIYLVTGDDTLLKDEFIMGIINKNLDKNSLEFNLHTFNSGEVEGSSIENIALSMPMFSNLRIVYIRGINNVAEEHLKYLENFITHKAETTLFILECEKADFRKKFFNLIKKESSVSTEVVIQDFKKPYANQIPSWIEKRVVSKYKRHVTHSASALILERVGPDLYQIDLELKKIISSTKKDRIEDDDIKKLIPPRYFNIFKLVENIAEGQICKVIEQLPMLLAFDPDAYQLLPILFRHFFLLLKIKILQGEGRSEEQIAEELELNLWYLRNILRYFSQVDRYSMEQISKIISGICDIEFQLRFRHGASREILEKWLISINN